MRSFNFQSPPSIVILALLLHLRREGLVPKQAHCYPIWPALRLSESPCHAWMEKHITPWKTQKTPRVKKRRLDIGNHQKPWEEKGNSGNKVYKAFFAHHAGKSFRHSTDSWVVQLQSVPAIRYHSSFILSRHILGSPQSFDLRCSWCTILLKYQAFLVSHFSSSSCSGVFASSSPLSSKSSCQALARSPSRCWALLLLPPFSFFSSFSFLSFFSSFPGFSPFPFFSFLSPFSFFPPFPAFLFPPFSVFFGFGSSSADASGSSGCGFFGFSGICFSRPLFSWAHLGLGCRPLETCSCRPLQRRTLDLDLSSRCATFCRFGRYFLVFFFLRLLIFFLFLVKVFCFFFLLLFSIFRIDCKSFLQCCVFGVSHGIQTNL